MSTIQLGGLRLPAMARVVQWCGERFAAPLDQVLIGWGGVPPAAPGDAESDDVETRMTIALICAAHW